MAWPVDADGTDEFIWESIARVLDEVDKETETRNVDFTVEVDEFVRALRLTTDKKGRKGYWVTIHGRRVFIPLKKAIGAAALSVAVPAAFTSVLLASKGGRALLKSLTFRVGKDLNPYKAKTGLLYALRHPKTALAAVKVANTLENPWIAYYGLPKGIKPDPKLLLVDGFAVSGSIKGVKQSTASCFISAHMKDTLEVVLVKARKKKALSGVQVMRNIIKMTRAAGCKKVVFTADINEGTYMWARMGAKWVETSQTKKARRLIASRVRRKLPELSRRITRDKISPYEIYHQVSADLGAEQAKRVFRKTLWTGYVDFEDPVTARYLRKLST